MVLVMLMVVVLVMLMVVMLLMLMVVVLVMLYAHAMVVPVVILYANARTFIEIPYAAATHVLCSTHTHQYDFGLCCPREKCNIWLQGCGGCNATPTAARCDV